MWDVPFHSTAPFPELVRGPEYAEELSLWASPDSTARHDRRERRGARPSARASAAGAWTGPKHARPNNRRPRWGGAILALTGAVALAGAVPLGILGVRTLTQRPAPVLTTAPLSASTPAGAPSQVSGGQTAGAPAASGAASASAPASAPASSVPAPASHAVGPAFALTAGPACQSVTGVITYPYRAPAGDGWHTGAAAVNGPCGSSFSYSYLADLPATTGNWHDHYAWIFHTGRPVAYCTLSFYIPSSAEANSTAYYWFSDGTDNPVDRMADFTIDQKSDQGQWVTKGPFTFPGGTVLTEVTDRGDGPASATVEAGVVRLGCR